jgi:hypothetical protein
MSMVEGRRGPKRRVFLIAGSLLSVLAVAVAGAPAVAASASRAPEGVPVVNAPDLASANTTTPGTPVDGITCRSGPEQVVKWHIHTHVAIYVRGQQKRLPAGIGITNPKLSEHLSTGLFVDTGLNDCLYWLHTHSNDDIVHIESPTKQPFTLGQLFDIWRQPLGPEVVGPASGQVVVFENGKRIQGDPRTVPLLKQGDIQLDVGRPVVPFHPLRFKVSGLCGGSTTSCAVPSTTTHATAGS